jgi:hypothetical protein
MSEAILWSLAILASAIAVLGAMPVVCEFRLSRDPDVRFRVLLTLLGGRSPRITLADSSRPQRPKAKKAPGKPHRRRKSERSSGLKMRSVNDLFWQLLDCIEIRQLSVEGRFGTGDPAETGQIFGLLSPLIHGLGPICSRGRIDLRPEFREACLEGHLVGEIAVTPFRLVPPFARFGWRLVRA